MTRFCLISHPLSPFFARKLSDSPLIWCLGIGAPHFYMWVPPPVVVASLNDIVAHKLNVHIILLKQICGVII